MLESGQICLHTIFLSLQDHVPGLLMHLSLQNAQLSVQHLAHNNTQRSFVGAWRASSLLIYIAQSSFNVFFVAWQNIHAISTRQLHHTLHLVPNIESPSCEANFGQMMRN